MSSVSRLPRINASPSTTTMGSNLPLSSYLYSKIVDVDVERHVIVSMMVMCDEIAIVIIEHDERRPGLPNAPILMEHDINRTEIKP